MSRTTLAQPVHYELEVKKSRFLAHAAPLPGPEAAPAFLAAHRDLQATHNCWAWRCGAQYRFSDDGEPTGTAGRPILLALERQQLDAVAVLVTRWYGGIKLGTGGLARAYGGAAAECLRQAPRKTLVHQSLLTIECGYAGKGVLYQLVQQFGASAKSEACDARCLRLEVQLPSDRVAAFQQALSEATRGTARVLPPIDPGAA